MTDPEGRAVGATFLRNNLGKRSITVNLKSDEGRQLVLDLHDVGAEAGQELGGVGERLHLLEGEDAHAVERLPRAGRAGVHDVSEAHGAEPSGPGRNVTTRQIPS
jgi:hypothetical protein